MSRPWKRANGEEQKDFRKREITDAALSLNASCPFSDMTLADIARHASFTRSNLYKYFSCREDLFLAILREEFLVWVERSEDIFSGRSCNLKEFSHLWIDLILQHPRLIELLSLSLSHLEKQAGEEALKGWYECYRGGTDRLNALIRNLFPTTERDDIDEFLNLLQAQIIGMVPLLNMDDRQEEIRRERDLSRGRSYYREILCHAVESLLSPWL